MHVTAVYAFIAGLASFLSPCVLPLVPGYISVLSGSAGISEEAPGRRISAALLRNSLLFILGFSIVFIGLGAAATSFGRTLRTHQALLAQVGGIIVIILGLHLTGIIKITALYSDKRIHSTTANTSGIGSFVTGFAFAFGWTPCIGPVLAAILILATREDKVGQGVWLLTTYSLGLAVPFLLTAVALDRFAAFYKGFRKHLHQVEVVSGALLVLIGVLLLTHQFTRLSGYLASVPFFNKLLL
jgi:cytochrome c-type biogenesis protein